MVTTRVFALLAAFSAGTAFAGGGLTYTQDAKPIFDNHCIECHHPGGRDPDLSAFPFASTAATDQTSIVDKVLSAAGGSQPQMPPGARPKLSADELATLTTWRDQGLEK